MMTLCRHATFAVPHTRVPRFVTVKLI